jgi:HlyD family secretion protein
MADTLFRQNAIDNASNPEQLDGGLRLMKPSLWLIAAILLVILAAAALWGFKGSIANRTEIKGVLFSVSDIQKVVAMTEGVVSDVLVSEGDVVSAGSIIAIATDTLALSEIEKIKEEIEKAAGDEKAQLEDKLRLLQESYLTQNVIKSSFPGYIQSVIAAGTRLSQGSAVATMSVSEAGSFNEVICYIAIEKANQLKAGMEAQITPAFLQREKYGYIYGTITEISSVPSSETEIIKHMGTLNYVNGILPDSLYVQLRISLTYDEKSANLYKWSNPNGETVSIAQGTVCDIQVVTRRKRPIDVLFE